MSEHQPGLRSNGNFRLYFGARIVSQLGDQLYVFAICWYVLDLTKSSLHMAALLAVNALAVMAVAPFGGLVADRVSRKGVMVGTDVIQGVVLLGLVALQQGHTLSIGMLYGATALLGLCSAVFSPAASALVPGIVEKEHMPGAVAAGQAAANICTIAGMLLGGALYRLIGIPGVLALNAASNLIAAVMESKIRVAVVGGTARAAPRAVGAFQQFVGEIFDGLHQVRKDRTVFGLLLVNTAFNLVALPIDMVYMPYLFNVILGASPVQAAVPQAATWAGIILGSAAAARLLRRHRPESVIAGGLLVLSVQTLLMVWLIGTRTALGAAWMSSACALCNGLAGAAGASFIVPLYALFHARSVDEFRGRFWGLESCLRTAAMCAGYFLAGALAQRLPLGFVFAGTGVVLAFLSVMVIRLRASPVDREVAVIPPG
jgi:DHA3 family macrolide efflux protein-like MFS transporter